MQDVLEQPRPEVIDREFADAAAWRGEDLAPDAGTVTLPAAVLGELDRVAALLRDNPLPVIALRPEDFDLAETRGLMADVRRQLADGVGFALIDRLPLERWSREEATGVTWLLCSLVARPVAQKWDGTMVYDVLDTGREPGNGVRPDKTSAEQNFHTDNSYNLCPPHYVALLCLQKAREGGMSEIVSFLAAHDEMRRRHPDLLARLYRPFHFDRQREHAPDEPMTTHHAMFENHGGRLVARLSRFQVINGQKLAGEELDPEGAAAMEALEEIMREPGMGKRFWFEPGQIQIVDNLRMGHRRTAFADWPEPERRRHLVRLWLRDGGRPFYHG